MKGDKGRFDPEQKAKYRDNYDAIFSKKPVVNTGEKRTAMDAEKVRSRVDVLTVWPPERFKHEWFGTIS